MQIFQPQNSLKINIFRTFSPTAPPPRPSGLHSPRKCPLRWRNRHSGKRGGTHGSRRWWGFPIRP